MGKEQELNRFATLTVILKVKYIVCIDLVRILDILRVHLFYLIFRITE